ncbi:hypothetical protein CHS0354_036573 [Potamilus streckersoni]|uniref:RING-type E3 ubiquitin transferase n=1 Tax=Potamilus streckersoni TaxID=2493646 RepID=A0AAE0TJ72_9BIVA|nr:hypothetical protein CHS0354_036573 [Potamilus streckersoni]
MRPGVRVVRGPHWRNGDLDGGVGYLGTVVRILQNNKVLVRWDIGTETECRAGTNGAFDLRIYDNAPIGINHAPVQCDMCAVHENHIQGMRWKCLKCRDFDQCIQCYYSDKHTKCNLSHSYVLFTTPRSTCVPVLPRRKSKKTKVYGIFPGADVIKAIVAPNEEPKVGKVVKLVDLEPDGYRGAVTVRWSRNREDDDDLPVYRVGAEGKMELKLVTPVSPGHVYLDHLPPLDLTMPMDVIFNPGDEVFVNLNFEAYKALNVDHHCWSPVLEDLFNNTGHVLDTDERFIIVKTNKYPSIKVYPNTVTKLYPIKAGDIVEISNDMEKVKKGQVRHGGWQDTFISLLGIEGLVERVDDSGDMYVLIKGQSFIFNPTCLQKINQPESGMLELLEKTVFISEPKYSMTRISCHAVDIGVRVVRGPDWKFGDQDGGEGHLGSVVDLCTDDDNEYYPAQTAVVIWDNGEKNVYRAGLDKQYDLRLYDNAGIGIRHEVTCAGCGLQTVPGILWRCNVCTGTALCSACYFEDKHEISHKFKRLDYADHKGEDVPPRITSKKVPAYGLFEKAKVVRGPDWRWVNQDGGHNKTGEVIAVVNYSSNTNHDAVEVTWENGYANVYRLGYKGYLDVKCVKPATGKRYYRDHLPILKINMITEPPSSSAALHASSALPVSKPQESPGGAASSVDRFKAGDRVRIEIEPDILRMMEQSRGTWKDGMLECVGQTGTVLVIKGQDVTVDFGSAGEWTFHEQCLNEVKQFSPGQVIQVLDNISSVKKMQEERVGWNEKMSMVIGKKGQVESIDEDGDVQVSFGEYTWTFSADCLVATQGNPDVINYEEDEAHSVPQPGPEEITSNTLFASIMIGDFKGVKNILQKEPQMMLLKEKEDKTPLHMASNCGNVEIVDFLCHQGVPLEDVDSDGNTPLLVASDKGHLEVMKLLIEKGAKKNAKNKNDEGAIFLMVKQKNKKGLKLLLELECDINSKDKQSQTPLYEAINSNDEELLNIILAWPRLDINSKDSMGFSPFCHACKKGNIYAVMRLLQIGADINDQQENTGHTGLHLAVYNNRRDIVDYLLKMPKIDKECRTKEGQSALHIATKEGFFEMVKLLIESGLAINGVDSKKNTCLHLCVTRKVTDKEVNLSETIVKYLIQKGVDINIKNQDGQTAFDLAPAQLKVLLEPRMFRADMNADGPRSLPTSGHGQTDEDVGPVSLPANPTQPMCGDCEEERADSLLLPCGHGICQGCKGSKPKKKCPQCKASVQSVKAL